MIRIFSDLHYGDRATSLKSLPSLFPLFEGASELILNGDTLDTRYGPYAAVTEAARAEITGFFIKSAPPTTFITGNHDPDISEVHSLEIADRRVFVTHGDILFENLVPWGRDSKVLHQRIVAELVKLPAAQRENLRRQLIAYRTAASSIPQRHQSEQNPWKYAMGFAADTIWPPLRILRVFQAWKETPARAANLLQRHGLIAKVMVMGHTHRFGATRVANGTIVINTGSFCPPTGAGVVDVSTSRVVLRSVVRHGKEFRLGPVMAEFALARVPAPETLQS